VEALSVTPFAPRALDRGLAGVLVALVRLLGSEYNENESADRLERAHLFVREAIEELRERAGQVTERNEVADEVRRRVEARIDGWLARRDALSTATLGYQAGRGDRTVPLLRHPTEQEWDDFTCLNSLRDVEPSVTLVLDDYGMDREASGQSAAVEEGGRAS
jgi:hypothetical protein